MPKNSTRCNFLLIFALLGAIFFFYKLREAIEPSQPLTLITQARARPERGFAARCGRSEEYVPTTAMTSRVVPLLVLYLVCCLVGLVCSENTATASEREVIMA